MSHSSREPMGYVRRITRLLNVRLLSLSLLEPLVHFDVSRYADTLARIQSTTCAHPPQRDLDRAPTHRKDTRSCVTEILLELPRSLVGAAGFRHVVSRLLIAL